MSEDTTNPVAEEEHVSTAAEGVVDEANAQGDDQPQLDDDGNPITPEAEDDSEEIDHEGTKFRIPKALKDSFLRQADYTRKTQEIAQTRQALEARQAEIAQHAEARQATYEDRVKLAVIDGQLEQIGAINWTEYAQTYGAEAAIAAQGQWQQLKDQRAALAGEVTAKEAEFVRSSEQVTANALREANEVLSREIQGFGVEMVREVSALGQTLGFSGDELRESFVGADGKADVRTFKALHELATLRAYKAATEAKNTKAQNAQKVAAVSPAATVNAKASGYKAGLNDDLPIDEWNRRRQAQLTKK